MDYNNTNNQQPVADDNINNPQPINYSHPEIGGFSSNSQEKNISYEKRSEEANKALEKLSNAEKGKEQEKSSEKKEKEQANEKNKQIEKKAEAERQKKNQQSNVQNINPIYKIKLPISDEKIYNHSQGGNHASPLTWGASICQYVLKKNGIKLEKKGNKIIRESSK